MRSGKDVAGRSGESLGGQIPKWTALIEEVRFVQDSPLEEPGFEPSAPRIVALDETRTRFQKIKQ